MLRWKKTWPNVGESLIASEVPGLNVPLIRVVLGPRESAMVSRRAVHHSAITVILGRASIAEVVVGRVDGLADAIASALGRATVRGVVL